MRIYVCICMSVGVQESLPWNEPSKSLSDEKRTITVKTKKKKNNIIKKQKNKINERKNSHTNT